MVHLGSDGYPLGTVEGFYKVLAPNNDEQLWAPQELITRDIRLFVHELGIVFPEGPDAIVPIANGGLEVGQQCSYKWARKSAAGKSLAKILNAQTRGYDELDQPLPELEIISAPQPGDLVGVDFAFIVDDLSDHYTALSAIKAITIKNAPKATIVKDGAVWAKRTGAALPDVILRMIPNLWIVFENQREGDADLNWYLDQVLDKYPNYLEDMKYYIEERKHAVEKVAGLMGHRQTNRQSAY